MLKQTPWLKKFVHNVVFEYAMGILALIIVFLYLSEFYNQSQEWTDRVFIIEHAIIVIFAFEYFVKLSYANNKWHFIKTHWIELLSIIPLSSLFQSLRIIRLIRVLVLLRFAYVHLERFFKRSPLFYVTFLTFNIVIIAAFSVYHYESLHPEPSMQNIGDALWWSWVTTTTVGYGDVTPKTPEGRIIAAVLMLVGISFLGVLTGTIASYFIRTFDEHQSVHNATLHTVIAKLRQLESMKREDIDEVYGLLIFLWEEEQKKKRLKQHPNEKDETSQT